MTLELLKIAILRNVQKSPVADGHELRLDGGDDTTLRFKWINITSEATVAGLSVPREVYDDVAGDKARDELRKEVSAGPFVDMDRLLIREEA